MFEASVRLYFFAAIGILLATAFFAAPALSQGGPPMITDYTGTVPKGHWEINTAFVVERTADGRTFGTPLLDVNYGLSKNMQLKVEIPWIVQHTNNQPAINGLGNTNIGVRWRFRDENEHHPQNYLLVSVQAPLHAFSNGSAQSLFFSYERGSQPPFASDTNALKLGYRIQWDGWFGKYR